MADRSISSFDLFSHRLWLILVLALNSVTAQAQYRKNLNKYWQFKKEGGVYRNVEVPHTWNAEDPFDDEPGYYRGKGYYLRDLIISEDEIGKALYLKFEAVNQYAIVSINGHELTKHKGGYTAFLVGIPPSIIHKGKNQLVVEVDNSHDPDVVPLKGDFNFYGGIYRDVWLEVENKVHFGKDPTHGTEKLKLHSEADEEQARLNINASIYSDGRNGRVSVGYQLYDADNLLLASYKTEQTLTGSSQFTGHEFIIKNPRLWSPDTPYLYHIEVLLKDIETGDLLDAAYEHYGFRYFRFDPDSGFYLNGKQLKLIGANRHQDYPGLGNALSNDRHRKDIKLLKEMGANFFRTAHYPQDQAVLNACDSLGLLVSMEIPFDHEYTNSETFLVQTKAMLSEMILQYYNHPSIIIWASMNEMFLGRSLKKDIENIENIVTLGHEMENQMRSTDPSRYTMIPNHGAFDLYHQPGLTQIPMLVGWNLYFGWYENDPENLTRFLNHFHEQVPDKPVIITEYGAGADPRIRSLNPERFDFSIDWQFQYHMSYLNQFEELDYLSGAAVWNLFDFGSEFRQDAVPHINSKGLMSYDRQPKDTYFLYRARLTNEPFAEILPTQFPVLPASLKQDTLNWPIKVVSNLSYASIEVNGTSYPSKELQNGVAEWNVPLTGDSLYILATARDGETEITLEKVYQLSSALNINLGANFYFHDPQANDLWRPDQRFEKGKTFGHSGGDIYRPRQVGIGVSRGIDNTDLDPVYQTQNQGLESYTLELKPGEYDLRLLWCRLDPKLESRFEVFINGKKLDEIDTSEMQEFSGMERNYPGIRTGKELEIQLKAIKGKTFLNGIQIVSSK